MSSPIDRLKDLIKEVNTTIDFVNVEKQLQEIIEEIKNDTSLLAFQKDVAFIGAQRALDKLKGRLNNQLELANWLEGIRPHIELVNEKDIKDTCEWFFKAAYLGMKITTQMEQDFRLILVKKSPNPGSNKDNLDKACKKYERFAEEGLDLEETRHNLEAIKIASRVYILPTGFSDKIRDRAENALQTVDYRQKMAPTELITGVVSYCEKLINPAYENFKKGEENYLQKEDSWFLNIYLAKSLDLLENNDFPYDEALSEKINQLRSKFQLVRYRSSTFIFLKLVERIEYLREKAAKEIDFIKLKNEVKVLQEETKKCQRGKNGVNRMESYHVEMTFSMISEVYVLINYRHHSKEELELEIKRFEQEVIEMSNSLIPPAARAIQRVQKYADKDSLLGQWISSCYPQLSYEKNRIVDRIKNILILCQEMWIKMEMAQQHRLNEFHTQCESIERHIKCTVDFRSQWSEIRQLERSIEDFPYKDRKKLIDRVNGLKLKMVERINDRQALIKYIEDLESSVGGAGHRIKYFIDFDSFQERAILTKRWVESDFFKHQDQMELWRRVQKNFTQIRVLKKRQEKYKAERAHMAMQLYEDLLSEVNANVEEAVSKPGSPHSWQLLIDLDRRVRESFNILDETQKNDLKKNIDTGFEQVKQLRVKFASEAAIVFASYSDELNNILAELEKENNRSSAYEAIESIKPIRSKFKDETRLLRVQKEEINNLIRTISSTIDEIFEEEETRTTNEFNRIQADLEKLDYKIKMSSNWSFSYLESVIDVYNQLSQYINQADLRIAYRKACRAEMDRLWTEISEMMRIVRANRFSIVNLGETMRQLERDGYLLFTSDIPNIK